MDSRFLSHSETAAAVVALVLAVVVVGLLSSLQCFPKSQSEHFGAGSCGSYGLEVSAGFSPLGTVVHATNN